MCGEVELTSRDISLMVCNHAALSYYRFDCPTCRDEVQKPADDHIISLLMSGGVRAHVWEIPAEALETHSGLPLSYDDLLANDVELFTGYRRELMKHGIFELPLNLKRSHFSYAHTDEDVDRLLEATEAAVTTVLAAR